MAFFHGTLLDGLRRVAIQQESSTTRPAPGTGSFFSRDGGAPALLFLEAHRPLRRALCHFAGSTVLDPLRPPPLYWVPY